MGTCASSQNADSALLVDAKQQINSLSNMNLHRANTLLDMDDMNKKTNVEASNVAETLTHLGHVCLSQNKFTDAKNFYERALKIYEKAVDEKSIHRAETRQHLAKCLVKFGRHEDGLKFWCGINPNSQTKYLESVTLLESVLPVFREAHGNDSTLTALIYADFGETLNALTQYDGAEDYLKNALEIMDKNLAFDTQYSPRGVECVFNTHGVLKTDFALAGGNGMEITVFDIKSGSSLENAGVKVGMELYQIKDSEGLRVITPADDVETLLQNCHVPVSFYFRQLLYKDACNVLTLLSITYSLSGKYDAARAHFERAMSVSKFMYGESSLEYADLEMELGNSLKREGRFEESYRSYSRAFSFHEKSAEKIMKELDVKMSGIKGKVSFDDRLTKPAFLMVGMTQVLLGSARAEETRIHAERAVKLTSRCYGNDHAWVALAQNMGGCALYLLKRYEEGAVAFKEASKTYSLALDEKHPARIHCLVNRACCLARAKPGIGINANMEGVGEAHMEALELLDQALGLYAEAQVVDHMCIATVYSNKAMIHFRKGEFAKSIEYQTTAREVREKVLPEGHVLIGCSHLNLASSHLEAKDIGNAYNSANIGFDILKREIEPDHEGVASCNVILAHALLGQAKTDEAYNKFDHARRVRKDAIGKPPRRLLLNETARMVQMGLGTNDAAFGAMWKADVEASGENEDTREENANTPPDTKERVDSEKKSADRKTESETSTLMVKPASTANSAEKKPASVDDPKARAASLSWLGTDVGPRIDDLTDVRLEVDDYVEVDDNHDDGSVISYCSSNVSESKLEESKRKGMAGKVTIQFKNVNATECVGVLAEWSDVRTARHVFVEVGIEVIADNHMGKQGISQPLARNRQPFCLLLQQGACSFVEKANCAAEVGAIGFVVFRKDKGQPFVMSHTAVYEDPPKIPGIMISQEMGEHLYGACMTQKDPRITSILKNARPSENLKKVEEGDEEEA